MHSALPALHALPALLALLALPALPALLALPAIHALPALPYCFFYSLPFIALTVPFRYVLPFLLVSKSHLLIVLMCDFHFFF